MTSGAVARDLGGLLLGVTVNLLLLYGVIVLGWSPGSIFLLFPVESVGLGVVTVVRLWARSAPNGPACAWPQSSITSLSMMSVSDSSTALMVP